MKDQMLKQVQELVNKTLPQKAYKDIALTRWGLGGDMIRIMFAASDHDINRVKGQKPQIVSLALTIDSLELEVQHFGGDGGQSIYRKPNMDDPSEKYLAMKSVRIPFRRPQNKEKAVFNALEKFCINWVKALKENREVLVHQDVVNYDELLNS